MDEQSLLTDRFDRERPRLHAVARRMLGSNSDADDAVQEAWLRIRDHDPDGIRSLQAWMTTVVSRVCLNMLRSRRARPEVLTDFHVPDPVVVLTDDGIVGEPEREVLLGESVGLALLVVLDALSPAERVAFVLHDVFGVPFAEIAAVLDRSEAAAQQLASRARRRVSVSASPDGDLARQREIVDAFFAAARDGDFAALLTALDPDVELRIDGGIRRADASIVLRGAPAVSRHTSLYAGLHPYLRPAIVNGTAGVVVAPGDKLFAVLSLSIADGRITRIDALLNRDRLARLRL